MPQKHHARKRFGQNFLQDYSVIQNILEAINPQPNDHIVEIGPGQAALTEPLYQTIKQLDIIEIDRDLVKQLKQRFTNDSITIHEADALQFNFNQLHTPPKLRVVGNLPYNISSPLLFHLIQFNDSIQDMHTLLQKEVVDRINAKPNTSNYGRLSVMIQFYCKTEALFDVPPTAFDPIPKVNSTLLRLIPSLHSELSKESMALFQHVVKTAFTFRRKTLRNSLQKLIPKEKINQLSIDLSLRPQALSIDDYLKLSNEISHLI